MRNELPIAYDLLVQIQPGDETVEDLYWTGVTPFTLSFNDFVLSVDEQYVDMLI